MAQDYAERYILQVFLAQHGALIYDQCHRINKSHPLAVARNIEKMYNIIKDFLGESTLDPDNPANARHIIYPDDDVIVEAFRILADIKKEA